MESLLITIDYHDPLMLAVAFLFGFGFYRIGLPPLVGFLAAGFALGAMGAENTPLLTELADLGVTLLLFTIGLKLRVSSLLKPEIWGVATLHMLITVIVFSAILLGFGAIGLSLFAGLNLTTAVIVAFALSFSSTVFAVKIFESKGEMEAIHGRIAIGLLIVQDIFAVVFIAASDGKLPSLWALLLIGLIPLRPFFFKVLEKVGHGELLILMGWILPLAGAALFESVGVKADLGALALGILLAGHRKTNELAKALFGFKDLFLIGFFLTIGLSGGLDWSMLGAALLLVALIVPIKTAMYFLLMTRQRLRARSATLASMGLSNFSEFGLIVGAIGVSHGWMDYVWLSVLAVALAISFLLAAPLNAASKRIYRRWHDPLQRFETTHRLPGDEVISAGGAQVVVFGMGRVGTGAYDDMRQRHGEVVIGIDFDEKTVQKHLEAGRKVILGDPTDHDFWAKTRQGRGKIQMVLLTLPEHTANMTAVAQLTEMKFAGSIAATAKFDDEVEELKKAGVHAVFNLYAEAGYGFAEHVCEAIDSRNHKKEQVHEK